MDPSFAEGTSRRRMLTGTAASLTTALLQPGCSVQPTVPEQVSAAQLPAPDTGKTLPANPSVLDEKRRHDFMELSAVLTGLHGLVTDPMLYELHQSTAEEYWRRLRAVFPDEISALVEAYRRVNPATRRQVVSDAVLQRLQATPEFRSNVFAARQIVNIWYLSQFDVESKDDPPVTDGGFYERALIWPLIKVRPPGLGDQTYGHWAQRP